MKKVYRALLTKAIYFKANAYTPKNWTPPLIHDELYEILERTTCIGERRHPPLSVEIELGRLCLFINTYNRMKNGALQFSVCAYRHGHVPESFSPDFSKGEAEVKAVEITDEEGNKGELVYAYQCLAYGQIIVIELVQGSGAAAALERLLGALLRADSGIGRKYPKMELNDIVAPSLKELIESHGGVSSIKARMLKKTGSSSGKFAKLISNIANNVGGANKCAVEWVKYLKQSSLTFFTLSH